MYVSRSQMRILLHDLFYGHSLTIPSEDETYTETRAGHYGSTSTTVRDLLDIAIIDFGHILVPLARWDDYPGS